MKNHLIYLPVLASLSLWSGEGNSYAELRAESESQPVTEKVKDKAYKEVGKVAVKGVATKVKEDAKDAWKKTKKGAKEAKEKIKKGWKNVTNSKAREGV